MQPVIHESHENRIYLRWNGQMRLLLSLLLAVGIMIPLWMLVFAFGTDFGQCELQADGHCHWIMGMDATFLEGEAIPERAVFNDLPTATGVHSYTWTATWTDSNRVHGYDWLVSFEQAQALHQYYTGQALDLNLCGLGSNQTEATCAELRYPVSPTVTYSRTITVPDDPYISGSYNVWGATQPRIDAFEAIFGNRTMTLWANAPITNAYLTFYHALDDANSGFPRIDDGQDAAGQKSVIRYSLWFETSASDVMLEYAAHFALTGDEYVNPLAWGFDEGAYIGLGAGGLYPNGMWHIKDHTLGPGDPNIGSQDNQAKVRLPYLFPIESTASNPSGIRNPATDRVTITTSANDEIAGTVTFYLCADTTYPYTDTLTHGCTSIINGSGYTVKSVGAVSVTYRNKTATATSPVYLPTLNGRYCYLAAFTPIAGTYGPYSDTNGTSECFDITSTTSVRLSSFRVLTGNDPLSLGGFSMPLVLIGLCGIAGGLAIWKFGFHRG